MPQETLPSFRTAMLAMWLPLVVGLGAIIVFRNLYGVAVLFAGYAVSLSVLARGRRAALRYTALGVGIACLVASIGLVAGQALAL